jgi:hypothetical protein
MPASADIEDVRQIARIAAWEADVEFVGTGSREGFISQRVQRRIIDWQRQQTPGGRDSPGYQFADVDDAHDLAGPDDPAGDLEHSREFEARMSALPKAVREQAEGVLSGRGKSSDKLLSLVESAPKRAASSTAFNPDAVLIRMGSMPSTKERTNKYRQLMDRMPATGSVVLHTVAAEALRCELKEAGLAYMTCGAGPGKTEVWREPSPEQRAARKSTHKGL